MPRERRCDPQALRQCSGHCAGLFSGAADGKPFIVAITNSDLDSYQCIRLFAMDHIRGLFLKEPSPRAVDTAAILSRSLFGWLVRPPRPHCKWFGAISIKPCSSPSRINAAFANDPTAVRASSHSSWFTLEAIKSAIRRTKIAMAV